MLIAEVPRIIRLAAHFSDSITVAATGGLEMREYRLAKSSALSEGVVRELRVPLGIEVDWHMTPRATLTLGGGAAALQELRFDGRRGEVVRKTTPVRAGAFGARLAVAL